MTATYATPLNVLDYLDLTKEVPSYHTGNTTKEEVVVPAGASTTTVYVNHPYVIDGTYTFSYGASATGTQTTLTETTHYTFDNETGAFTLTSAGVTLVGANGVYGAYKYNDRFKESKIQALLDRMEDKLDELTNNHWCDGSVATPNYLIVTEEEQDGKGHFDLAYYTKKYPINNITTTVNGDIAIGVTTITVVSTSGFPSSGYLNIGNEKIAYSAKSDTTFTCTATIVAYSTGDAVNSFVVEASNTAQGGAITWTTLAKNTDFDIDFDTGRITLYRDDILGYNISSVGEAPVRLVPNRFRFTGLIGHNTIPAGVTQLLVLMVAKELYASQVLNAVSRGTDGFSSNGITDTRTEIERLTNHYTNIKSSNI